MTKLQKTQTILVKPHGWSKGVQFGQVYFTADTSRGTEEHRLHEFKMDKSVWEDMGSPETITVTIEPGDALNERE